MSANKGCASIVVGGLALIGLVLIGLAAKFWLEVRATPPEHVRANIRDVAGARTRSRFLIVEGGVADAPNVIRYSKTKRGRSLETEYFVPLLEPPAAPGTKPAVVVMFSGDEFEARRQAGMKFDSVKGVIPPMDFSAKSMATSKLEQIYGKSAVDGIIFLTRTDRSPTDPTNAILLGVSGLLLCPPLAWRMTRRPAAVD